MASIEQTTDLCRLLSDPTRVRLIALLEQEELTVAELTQLTQLSQPRVSNHLAKLRKQSVVVDRRAGASSYYRFNSTGIPADLLSLWQTIKKQTTDDALLEEDRERVKNIVAARSGKNTWAETVAGEMKRHYSPGRTWEATARGLLSLIELGDVLDVGSGDGVIAEILSRQAKSITCLDVSEKVLEAGRDRLSRRGNVNFIKGDMHNMPLDDGSFDQVLLLHALSFTKHVLQVAEEAARVLRPGGRLVAVTLAEHQHDSVVQGYDHLNDGFKPTELAQRFRLAGLDVTFCEVTSREDRTPHFEVITLLAQKPA